MAASRRSTRASAMKVVPTQSGSNRVYGRKLGVSIETMTSEMGLGRVKIRLGRS
jgi:hypothetical protein